MRHLIILFALLFSFTSCKGQDKDEITKKEFEKLIERELKNQDRAKYGGSNSEIKVITAPKEVGELHNYIVQKNSERKEKNLSNNVNKSLSERYKAGDKSTVPQIIQVLNGNDVELKHKIYRGLARDYDEIDHNIDEPDLVNAILNNITIPEDEKAVIQLSGYMELEGYPKLFEVRLLSGKSKDENRLFYWLGKDGQSMEALNYVENLIFSKNFDFDNSDYVMSGLHEFAENGNFETKSKAFNIALRIYDEKLIPKKKFEEMKTSWSSTNPAIDLTEILLSSDDKRVIPIAKYFIKNEVREDMALKALVKFEGEIHKDLVLSFLKDKDKFYDGLNAASELYKKTKDKTIIRTILEQFENRDDHPEYSIDRIISSIISMEATEIFANLDTFIKNKKLNRSILKIYELRKGSIETVAKDLYEFGVLQEPLSEKVISAAYAKSETEDSYGYVYDILSASNLYLWFDAETGTIPVDYDMLILEFVKISNGKLNDAVVWMDAEVDKDYNVEYKILVSANDKIYVMSPEDIGDWYDIEMTFNLMNKLAEDANLSERYIFIDTGDQSVQALFGPIKSINKFVKKYNLN